MKIQISLKISDGKHRSKKGLPQRKSAEVVVGRDIYTKGPNVYMVQLAMRNVWIVRNRG